MEFKVAKIKQDLSIDIYAIADLIAATQRKSGEIPWCDGQKTDPWDHVEAAMGLTIGGYFKEAQLAFEWLSRVQLSDGSWFSSYMNGAPEDKTREANMASYVAVGVFHYYLITGDKGFLNKMWDAVRRAIDFTIRLQAPGGEIYWAISPEEKIDLMALLTGSSSIYMSLKCAISVSQILGHEMPEWADSLKKLGNAIRNMPYLFNMTKSRFSMDWFYPVLTGAITGIEAQKRISRSWKKFIVKGQGVRCVSDEPWVTIAETSELSLALSAIGNVNLSQIVFNWICGKTYEDGSYWCGFTVPDMTIWPEEKITWTNAVVLMAADAIYNLTPAGRLFCHDSWNLSCLSSSGAKAKDNNICNLVDSELKPNILHI
jgi:hypothetical protein